MAGLPVISTQECPEYRELLERYDAGINCDNGDVIQLAEAIASLYNDIEGRHRLGNNNRKLAEELFDRKNSYNIIEEIILNGKK